MAAPPAPIFGGWRNLDTAADAAVREENMPFAMLPVEVPRRTRLALLPHAAGMDWDTLMVSERYMRALELIP